MTIFHIIKYTKNNHYDTVSELPDEMQHQFWKNWFNSDESNMATFVNDFLLDYDDIPHTQV